LTHDLDRFDIKKNTKEEGKIYVHITIYHDNCYFVLSKKKFNGIIVMSILIFVQVSLVIIKLIESIVFLFFKKT
jgi:hypothetical protein